MTEGKWIRFEEFSDTGKTKVFSVINKEYDSPIGLIKWYGPFRKYSFFPHPNTAYEEQCLMDIIKFLQHLMLQRKLKKQSESL